MNENKDASYIDYLASSSDALLNYIESEKFINWAIAALFQHLSPSHVSVALFDPKSDAFLIKYSVGVKRFPMKFVRLQRTSAIVEWFSGIPSEKKSSTVMAPKKPSEATVPGQISEELNRHLSVACAQIKSHHNLGGYLLVGEPQTTTTYTADDQVYFQAVANNIAVEIEKQHYYQSAHFDPLTKLLNRQSLSAKLEACIDITKKTGAMFALCMVDLDNFKKINDTHGHVAGDEVLRSEAQILRKGIRETDFIFRYGGEEFLIILWRQTRNIFRHCSREDFQKFAYKAIDRLRRRLAARPIEVSQVCLTVTASIGMTFVEKNNLKSAQELIEEADQAVYASKHSGKNKVTVYSPELGANPEKH